MSTIAIMQPYFFPYIGYFSLIKHTDKFVIFDPVQYIKKGWINRNRVLKPGEGWQYIIAPVQSHEFNALIKDIQVVEGDEWKTKIIRQLDHYKKRSPFYKETIQVLEECFQYKETSITKINTFYLNKICQHLEIEFDNEIYSEMDLDVANQVNASDEWALRISEAMRATTYINPPGGMSFFDKSKYDLAGIKLEFMTSKLGLYNQKRPGFEAGLSIIDVMMFNDVPTINVMLDQYELS
ncbi:WbqC family protein [Rufibacter sp. XAAS-G3-1]|uniref:WbqC family protein n=1 Tax=Rufibacter sp. XAAS-G3-1 TaxID=2729134 RepID=UPI0015E6CFBF|nr:WbqC family protein [Rufibacter sp. XAAS-G3-1]